MSEWISVDDRRPPKNKSSLFLAGNGIFYVGKERCGNLGEPQQSVFAYRCDSSGRFTEITHWMPLPKPPKN
jgi:hypothetical protein